MAKLDELFEKIKGLSEKDLAKLIKETEEHPKWGKGRLWIPNPGGQTLALNSEADELFFGGRPGGGKSSLLIGTAICDHKNSVIFRREYSQIKGLEQEALRILGTRNGYNAQDHIWRIPNTDKIMEFGSVPNEYDRERWQGRAHDLKCFDEICHFSRSIYKYITLWLRSATPDQRKRIICAGNPPTSSEGLWVIEYWAPWLDEHFHDKAEHGELRWPVIASDDSDTEIFFRTREEALEHAKTLQRPPVDANGDILPPRSRSFIPGNLEENPDLIRSGYASVLAYAPKELRDLASGKFNVLLDDHPNQVIPTSWIIEAQKRWVEKPPKGAHMTALAIDVAGGGVDNNVIARRYDGWYDKLIVIKGKDAPNPSDITSHIVRYRRDGAPVIIDCGGGYGGSVVDQLRIHNRIECVKHFGAHAGIGRSKCKTHKFYNRRAEVWWKMREALDPEQQGGSPIMLPLDNGLKSDLASLRFEIVPRGIKVETKKELKVRIGRSPDRGDAVVMCWAEGQRSLEKHAQFGGKETAPQFARMRSGPLSRKRR